VHAITADDVGQNEPKGHVTRFVEPAGHVAAGYAIPMYGSFAVNSISERSTMLCPIEINSLNVIPM
jgi:hypothetical protein